MNIQNCQKSMRRIFQQNLLFSRSLEHQILPKVVGAENIVLGRRIVVRQCNAITGKTVFAGEWSTIGGAIISAGLFTASALIKNQATEITEFRQVRLVDITYL